MPTASESFDTSLKQILCDRVCGMANLVTENATLTLMDAYWTMLTLEEKQKVLRYFTAATAPGARVALGKATFPRSIRTLPVHFTGISTRYSI